MVADNVRNASLIIIVFNFQFHYPESLTALPLSLTFYPSLCLPLAPNLFVTCLPCLPPPPWCLSKSVHTLLACNRSLTLAAFHIMIRLCSHLHSTARMSPQVPSQQWFTLPFVALGRMRPRSLLLCWFWIWIPPSLPAPFACSFLLESWLCTGC